MEGLLEFIDSAKPEDLEILSQQLNKRKKHLFYLSLPKKRFGRSGVDEINQTYAKHARSDDPSFDVNRVKSSGCDVDWDAYYDNGNGIFIHVGAFADFNGRDGETTVDVYIDGKRCE
jgi:hypothetical protein